MQQIWRWFSGEYRAHVTPTQYKKIIRWGEVSHGSTYRQKGVIIAYDIQFPSDLLGRVKTFVNTV